MTIFSATYSNLYTNTWFAKNGIKHMLNWSLSRKKIPAAINLYIPCCFKYSKFQRDYIFKKTKYDNAICSDVIYVNV
jgi:hypothetical protein